MMLYLAPMEGLTDYYMRDMLTQMGHYDACVTEFVRVTDRLLPERTFYHACPELYQNAKTASGTPVHLQLLGSDPLLLAENAAVAVSLGAPIIDLNFGCPAKTVNRHRGGAVLLDEPELVFQIVQAVKGAVSPLIPVTAKMRLGVKDKSRMIENAQAIEQAGAAQLVVHARTKESGYRPPADWEALALIREAIHIPLMANGEIWTREDALLCQKISGCKSLMLGRGAVSHPQLVNQIRAENIEAITWQDLRQWQIKFLDKMKEASLPSHEIRFGAVWTERGAIGRYKQWLGMLTRCWPEAVILFSQIKKLQTWDEVMAIVMQE